MASMHTVKVRRAYDQRRRGDGARVLVDRIWPRGLSKEKGDLDEWCKTVAPSTELRKWYAHDPERFEEFGRRYRIELEEPERAEALQHLRDLATRRNLTLLTATKEAGISEATVLADLIGNVRGHEKVRTYGHEKSARVATRSPQLWPSDVLTPR